MASSVLNRALPVGRCFVAAVIAQVDGLGRGVEVEAGLTIHAAVLCMARAGGLPLAWTVADRALAAERRDQQRAGASFRSVHGGRLPRTHRRILVAMQAREHWLCAQD